MKSLTTMMVLSIIVMGSAVAQHNSFADQAAFVKTSRSNVYKLIVDTGQKSHTIFNIYDEKGDKLFTDRVFNRKGFSRNYNFKNIPDGLYKLEVEKGGNILTQNLEHEKNFRYRYKPALFVDLNRVEGTDKVDLKVNGAKSRMVQVKIKDTSGQVLYTDRITGLKGFTRTYDIARIGKDVAFEVKIDNQVYKQNL